ncbi:GNAT family N-acetyltransferase [Streptomyces sp. QL37]|uniref:GNAT family N-acetyltransferase n=1 Tax=Streptomyces sp. QL37 TaxID=2093747 RepID=UPI000CF2FB92|nr:GNAT family N-acetyltransferase [Streptomyces sp. QL37]PPQ57825.1 GNAT family N-acetyltransferase [Streptomyces sp. QL37]
MSDDAVTLTAGTLLLRPWRRDDIPALLAAYDDPAMRRWLRTQVPDAEEAERWLTVQEEGWASGTRFSFAVTDTAGRGDLVGNLALNRPGAGAESAQAGYWTTASARGRGVAPRALGALTDWAFATLAEDGLRRLDLFHGAGNEASCRVAGKAGFPLAELVPARPPRYPLGGHRHSREAPLSAAADRRAGCAGTSGGPATSR